MDSSAERFGGDLLGEVAQSDLSAVRGPLKSPCGSGFTNSITRYCNLYGAKMDPTNIFRDALLIIFGVHSGHMELPETNLPLSR